MMRDICQASMLQIKFDGHVSDIEQKRRQGPEREGHARNQNFFFLLSKCWHFFTWLFC
jgi:hypothetical protein